MVQFVIFAYISFVMEVANFCIEFLLIFFFFLVGCVFIHKWLSTKFCLSCVHALYVCVCVKFLLLDQLDNYYA